MIKQMQICSFWIPTALLKVIIITISMSLIPKMKKQYSIPLNNLLTPEEYNKFENLGLKKDVIINVDGVVQENNIITPQKIRNEL